MKQHVRKRNALHLALRLHHIPDHHRFIAVEVVFYEVIRTRGCHFDLWLPAIKYLIFPCDGIISEIER
jgi:hypothetical protein